MITTPTSVTKERSASETKLNAFGIDMEKMLRQSGAPACHFEECYLLVQKSIMLDFFSILLCPMCKQPGLTFATSPGKWGYATKARLACEVCDKVVKEDFLCERVVESKSQTDPFGVNLRATLAFRGIGCGHSAMKEWASTMNLAHVMSYDAYRTAHQKIADASRHTFQEIARKSREAIVSAYNEIGEHPDENGILNIAVSFDGSWQKRGFTSHNGIAVVIDLPTGLPIDFEVLSNFCIKCKAVEGEQDDLEWKKRHEPNCPKNFEGTLAACQFSMGATFKTILCKILGLVPGENLKRKAAASTALRLERAEKATTVVAKKRRKELKFKTKLKANKQNSLEGDTYAAGPFDC